MLTVFPFSLPSLCLPPSSFIFSTLPPSLPPSLAFIMILLSPPPPTFITLPLFLFLCCSLPPSLPSPSLAIMIVSGLDNEVECSLGGLRRAHTQNPRENGVRTGLQWDPRSQSMVLNANPGMLQWYEPGKDTVVSQVGGCVRHGCLLMSFLAP